MILTVFKILSIIRIVFLIITSFFLTKGVLEIPIPSISIWLNIILLLSFINIIVDLIHTKLFKNSSITGMPYTTIVWIIFLKTSGLIGFLINNNLGIQTLISSVTLTFIVIYAYQDLHHTFDFLSKIKISSRLLITSSFLFIISLGTFLLMLPISIQANQPRLSLIDAFFTATSAVCVTGLIVVDTATYFSRFGQGVILLLIQIGALGLVTITTVFLSLLGQNLSLTGQLSAKDSVSSLRGDKSLVQFLGFTLNFTIFTELLIAIGFFISFIQKMPLPDALFFSIFHAISAFCNAGFSLFSDSLMGYRGDTFINTLVMLAIIFGGLGFGVWADLRSRFILKESVQLQLQSTIAIRVSLILMLVGTILFYLFEKDFSLKGLSLGEQWLSSLFTTVNLRTAGFNTIDLGQTKEPSRFLSIIFMYIGASPGSTGGGIKTTSFMVLLAGFLASMRNDTTITIFNRRIDSSLLSQAWALVINSFIWIFFVTLIVSHIEQLSLSTVLYEIISAYATVGVTTGITGDLSITSKTLLSITMILGRIGPTTVMLALLGKSVKKTLISTPPTTISIG